MSYTILTYGFSGSDPYLIPTYGFGIASSGVISPSIDIELTSSIKRFHNITSEIARSISTTHIIVRQINMQAHT